MKTGDLVQLRTGKTRREHISTHTDVYPHMRGEYRLIYPDEILICTHSNPRFNDYIRVLLPKWGEEHTVAKEYFKKVHGKPVQG